MATKELNMLKDLKVYIFWCVFFSLIYIYLITDLIMTSEERRRRASIWNWGPTILCKTDWRTELRFGFWRNQAILSD